MNYNIKQVLIKRDSMTSQDADEDYYKSLEESNRKAAGVFYQTLNYKGD